MADLPLQVCSPHLLFGLGAQETPLQRGLFLDQSRPLNTARMLYDHDFTLPPHPSDKADLSIGSASDGRAFGGRNANAGISRQ